MKLKVGIGIVIAVFIALMVLPGMIGKLIGLVISILVWGSSGYLAGKLLQGEGYGLLGNVLLGLVGGFVGSALVAMVTIRDYRSGQAAVHWWHRGWRAGFCGCCGGRRAAEC